MLNSVVLAGNLWGDPEIHFNVIPASLQMRAIKI
jgi:hypothetical protein